MGTLIFSYIRRLESFFGFQILNFNSFLGFQKNRPKSFFLGMKTLWCHHKLGLYLGVISMYLRVFSEGQCTEWGIFFGVAKISIF